MDIEVDFSKLKALIEEMGADEATHPPPNMLRLDDLQDVQIGVISQIEQEDLIAGELEIDVFKLDIQGEVFAYKGEQLVIHIYETRKELDYVKDDPENNVRFHLTDCQTIDRMKSNNRFERYIGSQNRNGEFKVNVYIDENSNETVAAFTTRRDAEIAAVAIVEDKASLWEIPITENTTDGDKLGMVDNWSILTSQRESLGVFDCPLNILDRRDYA